MSLYLEILHVESDCVVVSLHDIRPHLTYVQHYHNWSHIFHGFDSIYSNIIHMLLHSIIIGCHLYMNSCNTSIFDQHIMRKKTPKPFVERKKENNLLVIYLSKIFLITSIPLRFIIDFNCYVWSFRPMDSLEKWIYLFSYRTRDALPLNSKLLTIDH